MTRRTWMIGGTLAALVVTASLAREWSLRQPVRLVAGRADTVIVNSRKVAQLPVQLEDGRGRRRAADGARFRRLSGIDVAMNERGHVTCDRMGDAVVEATTGRFTSRFLLRCRPIRRYHMLGPTDLVLGGPAQPFTIGAVGVDGSDVTDLVGTATVRDTSIVRLDAQGMLHARSAGSTSVEVLTGDEPRIRGVTVSERVRSTERMCPY